jgi:hypothetical protein
MKALMNLAAVTLFFTTPAPGLATPNVAATTKCVMHWACQLTLPVDVRRRAIYRVPVRALLQRA